MCYQYPFAVSPVVVPAPESHRSVSIPLGMLSSPQAVYRSLPCKHESSFIPLRLLFPQNLRFCGSLVVGHGILRRGIISPPDGYSIVKVHAPHLFPLGKAFCSGVFLEVFIFTFTCSDWEARFGGVFLKGFFTLPLVRTEIPVFSGVLKSFYLSTCSHWETPFGGGVLKNYLTPSLVSTGKPVLVGCSAEKFLPLLVWNEKTVLVMLFLKVFYYTLTCSH